MTFDQPTDLPDAVQILAQKDLLPTNLTSDELRQLDAYLRQQSLFSAQTTNEYLLQLYQDKLTGILNPVPAPGEATTQFSPAYVRASIKDFLQSIGYEPPTPEERGTITDLSSDRRINLVVKTNVEMAQGQGLWMRNQNPALLDEWPGQELFRAEARKVPRDWVYRFQLAGSQTGDPIGTGWTITPDQRLIALKNHLIWEYLGSSKLFPDGLDTSWPPFAFSSGMWVRNVDRQETEAIGLTVPGQIIPPQTLKQPA